MMYVMDLPTVPPRMIKDGEVACMYEEMGFWKGIADSMRRAAGGEQGECFIVCALHAGEQPLCIYLVRERLRDVRVPDICRTAILCGASDILVAHKYPQRVVPPAVDLRAFINISEISSSIGMRVVDYILIGGDEIFFSVKQDPDVWDRWADSQEYVTF